VEATGTRSAQTGAWKCLRTRSTKSAPGVVPRRLADRSRYRSSGKGPEARKPGWSGGERTGVRGRDVEEEARDEGGAVEGTATHRRQEVGGEEHASDGGGVDTTGLAHASIIMFCPPLRHFLTLPYLVAYCTNKFTPYILHAVRSRWWNWLSSILSTTLVPSHVSIRTHVIYVL